MAKQRRARSRSDKNRAQTSRTGSVRGAVRLGADAPPAAPAPRQPVARPGYVEAVALYEQGLGALQAREYSRASTLFRSVLAGYPDERELHERVRLYLNICERQTGPGAGSPNTPNERIYAATVACNAGDYDAALRHLRAATREAPDHDYALYMLAGVLALRDETAEAVPYLLRAIELNPENRAMARHDADLESLREHGSIRAALEATPPAKQVKAEHRRSPRRSR